MRPIFHEFEKVFHRWKPSTFRFWTVWVFASGDEKNAIKIAEGIRNPRLVLVDGERLAELMIEHGVGVQTKQVIRVSKLDTDFFSGG